MARPLSQPAPSLGVLVGAVVIRDQVDVDLIGDGPLALAQASKNFTESTWLLFFMQKTHIHSLEASKK